MTNLHPRLGDRHYEILGLESSAQVLALAERLIAAGVTATRLKERDLRLQIDALRATDAELALRLNEGW